MRGRPDGNRAGHKQTQRRQPAAMYPRPPRPPRPLMFRSHTPPIHITIKHYPSNYQACRVQYNPSVVAQLQSESPIHQAHT